MKYEIGYKIQYYRKLRGMSQKEFAEKIGVGNTRVSNWEQGLNRPDADILAIICEVLSVSADELLDIKISEEHLNEEEKQLIFQYRNKPELQQAVKILLGIGAK